MSEIEKPQPIKHSEDTCGTCGARLMFGGVVTPHTLSVCFSALADRLWTVEFQLDEIKKNWKPK